MNFLNKSIIVTGGTGALGTVVASRFFDAGATIAMPYRNVDSIKSVPPKMRNASERLLLKQTDLSSEEQVNNFVNDVVKKFDHIHCVVNIAGGYAGGTPIHDVTLAEWEGMMTLNLKTTFLMCRATLRVMRRQQSGRIVNIAAMPALTSGAKKGPYAISKRGVIALTEIIADEVKGTGITANAIAPGIIITDDNKASMPNGDLSKWVSPEEIADIVLFLCSESGRSINGNVLKMFGGL